MVGIFIWAGHMHDCPVGGTHSCSGTFIGRHIKLYRAGMHVMQGSHMSPLGSFRNVCGLAHAVRVHVHACLQEARSPWGMRERGRLALIMSIDIHAGIVSPSITVTRNLGRMPDSARVAGLNISVVGSASSLAGGTDETSSGFSTTVGPADQVEATGAWAYGRVIICHFCLARDSLPSPQKS
jgi:hypothetical protein